MPDALLRRLVRHACDSALVRQLALGGAALAALVTAATTVRPVYVGHEPVVRQLVATTTTWRDSAAARAPWAMAAVDDDEAMDEAMQSPRFEADRRAFIADLVRTGRMSPERADSIGTYAVREAYRRRIPPALIFGVLLTENSTFKSKARSNVGAVGLMQIYPKAWVPTLGKVFGRNLERDETNLRYGAHILSHYVYTVAEKVTAPDSAVSTALLRYNGCVRGTNTRNCHTYPAKVRRAVERFAVAQCGTGGYAACVEQPMRLSIAEGAPDVETR